MAAGKFEIYKDKSGEFRFRLKASNGQNLLAGESYKAKAGAVSGVESVKKNASDDKRYDKKTAASGKFHFSLLAANGQIVGVSEMYDTAAARDAGVASVKAAAPEATVADLAS